MSRKLKHSSDSFVWLTFHIPKWLLWVIKHFSYNIFLSCDYVRDTFQSYWKIVGEQWSCLKCFVLKRLKHFLNIFIWFPFQIPNFLNYMRISLFPKYLQFFFFLIADSFSYPLQGKLQRGNGGRENWNFGFLENPLSKNVSNSCQSRTQTLFKKLCQLKWSTIDSKI